LTGSTADPTVGAMGCRAVAVAAALCLAAVTAPSAADVSRGTLCGASACATLPSGLAKSLSQVVSGLRRIAQPKTAPTYLILINAGRLGIVWVPRRQAFFVSPSATLRGHWYAAPAALVPQLEKLAQSVKPNPAPRRWQVPQPLPAAPANALGRVEGSLCKVENCVQINRMIANWLRLGRIPQEHAVGAFYLSESGCLSCHTYRSAGAQALGAPPLTHIGNTKTQQQLIAAIRCPACGDPDSPMPTYKTLSKRQIGELTAFLAASH